MQTQPNTTTASLRRFVTGDTTEITIDVLGDPEHTWDINSVDWSSDQQPCPGGCIEIMDDQLNIVWMQFFNDPGTYSRVFGNGVLYFEKGKGFRIVVSGAACTKTLCVFYR